MTNFNRKVEGTPSACSPQPETIRQTPPNAWKKEIPGSSSKYLQRRGRLAAVRTHSTKRAARGLERN